MINFIKKDGQYGQKCGLFLLVIYLVSSEIHKMFLPVEMLFCNV